MSARMYLKVKKDICPSCGREREYLEQGICYRRGRVERLVRKVSWICECYGGSKIANPSILSKIQK